jgi:two-component system NtrC family sensor kinase
MHSPEAAPPRLKGISLRHRILLLVLGLGILPSALILAVTTFAASRAIRTRVLDTAGQTVQTQSQRLSDLVQGEVNRLRALAEQPRIAALAAGAPDAGAPASDHATDGAGSGQAIYLLGGDGPLGTLMGGEYRPGDDFPDSLVLATARRAFAFQPATAPFCLQGTEDAVDPLNIWAFVPVQRGGSGETLGWLAVRIDSNDFIGELKLIGSNEDAPLLALSSKSRPQGNEVETKEMREIVTANREIFSRASGEVTLASSRSIVYPYSRVTSLYNLTAAGLDPTSVIILQRAELDSATVALFYDVWQIALFIVVSIALIAVLGAWLSSRLVDPIMRLRAGFLRLEQGDLDYRIHLETGDEMEELARSVNRMAKTLQESYRNLADKLLELDEKAKQLTITHEIARAINRSLDLDILFRDISREFQHLVPSDQVALGLIDESGGELCFVYTYPEGPTGIARNRRVPLPGSLSEKCLESENVVVVRTNPEGGTPEEAALGQLGQVMLCVVPLRTTTEPIGVLLLIDSLRTSFRRQEIDILKRVSTSLATAIEHSKLYARQAGFATELERQVEQRTRDLKTAQEQLVRAERLAATGELAANFAHEINNPLSIIKNYLKLMNGTINRPVPSLEDIRAAREGIGIIGDEIDRIARIVSQLRKLHSPSAPEINPVNVNLELVRVVELFRQTFHEKQLTVETDLDPELDVAELCDDHLRQIVINLLRNAHDATETGGRIVVETKAHFPEKHLFAVRVRDNGIGIPPENLTKIFNPFFTTKNEKGSGLGLSVSYGLARNMGGRMEAASSPPGGALITLILPMNRGKGLDGVPGGDEKIIRSRGERIIIG